MAEFCLLADGRNYQANTWDLTDDTAGQEHSLEVLEVVFGAMMRAARQTRDGDLPEGALEGV